MLLSCLFPKERKYVICFRDPRYLCISLILSNPLNLEVLRPHFLIWCLSSLGSPILFIMGTSLLTNHDTTTSDLLLWNLTFPVERSLAEEPEREYITA